MSIHRLNDPLRAKLAETDARIRIADGDVRKAIETWVLTRAAYGCHVHPGLMHAMRESNMLGHEVAVFASPPPEEKTNGVIKTEQETN